MLNLTNLQTQDKYTLVQTNVLRAAVRQINCRCSWMHWLTLGHKHNLRSRALSGILQWDKWIKGATRQRTYARLVLSFVPVCQCRIQLIISDIVVDAAFRWMDRRKTEGCQPAIFILNGVVLAFDISWDMKVERVISRSAFGRQLGLAFWEFLNSQHRSWSPLLNSQAWWHTSLSFAWEPTQKVISRCD